MELAVTAEGTPGALGAAAAVGRVVVRARTAAGNRGRTSAAVTFLARYGDAVSAGWHALTLAREEVRQRQHVVRATTPTLGLENDDFVYAADGQLQIDRRKGRRRVAVSDLSGAPRRVEDHRPRGADGNSD